MKPLLTSREMVLSFSSLILFSSLVLTGLVFEVMHAVAAIPLPEKLEVLNFTRDLILVVASSPILKMFNLAATALCIYWIPCLIGYWLNDQPRHHSSS